VSASRLARWFDERPPRPADEYACALAVDRFWGDDRARLIGVHPDWPDATYLLGLREEIAHALVLVLSLMPRFERLAFAETFFEERAGAGESSDVQSRFATVFHSRLPGTYRLRLAVAAQIALLVLDLTESAALQEESVVDLLRGAAQGDDLTVTPEPAVDRLRRTVATVRFDPALEDDSDPHAVASLAVVEVLDPSSDGVALKEVLARAAFATVECRPKAQTLGFLLRAEEIFSDLSSLP
jgi:hypothetical protein